MIMFWGIICAWIVKRRDIRAGNAQTKSSSPMRSNAKSAATVPTQPLTAPKTKNSPKTYPKQPTSRTKSPNSSTMSTLSVPKPTNTRAPPPSLNPTKATSRLSPNPPRTSSCSLTGLQIATTQKRWRTSTTRRMSSGRLNWCRSLKRISRSRKRRTGCTRTRRGGVYITQMGLTWGLGSCTRRWGRVKPPWFIRLSSRVMCRAFCRRWRMIMVGWRWGISEKRKRGVHYLEYTKDPTANPLNNNSTSNNNSNKPKTREESSQRNKKSRCRIRSSNNSSSPSKRAPISVITRNNSKSTGTDTGNAMRISSRCRSSRFRSRNKSKGSNRHGVSRCSRMCWSTIIRMPWWTRYSTRDDLI